MAWRNQSAAIGETGHVLAHLRAAALRPGRTVVARRSAFFCAAAADDQHLAVRPRSLTGGAPGAATAGADTRRAIGIAACGQFSAPQQHRPAPGESRQEGGGEQPPAEIGDGDDHGAVGGDFLDHVSLR